MNPQAGLRRLGLYALGALLLAGCTARTEPTAAHAVTVTARPVALDVRDPTRTTVGELRYAGGLILTGDSAKFGGFSGLVAKPDGRFLSQSDEGWLLRGRIVTDAAGRLSGVEAARLSPLLDEHGAMFRWKGLADAEDIAFVADPAHPDAFAISFEGDVDRGRSRVSVYDSPQASERVIYRAKWADTALHVSTNYSFEALTRCPGESRFLLGTEDGQIVFLDPKRGRIENRSLIAQPPGDAGLTGLKLTGLDCMPDGHIFALYRAFDPFHSWRAMVALLNWEPSSKGPVLHRHELARLDGSLTRDNMEGIAAAPGPDGGARLYLISDDNFDELQSKLVGGQRTLLLAFDWTPPAPPR